MADALSRLNSALVGRYQVIRELGQGGMAVVYLAEDLRHHRNVALKVLRPELAAIVGAERFLKEIEVTARLQHPNILPLYDSGEAASFLYYVMPLAEGETLRQKLDREGELEVEEAVDIARSVAAALDYAHRQGVIHRDVKPANILLQDGQAMVSDFGIALAMRQAGEGRLTETGLSVGTPHYMSPEQAAGDREIDARSDVYSLGAVTYEMLVGEPPHVGKTAQAVVVKILSETPAPIRRTRELVPANVEAAVTRALARSRADRFHTAAEFAAALANPGFTLPTMTVAAGGAPIAPRSRWVARASAATLVVAPIAMILAAWGWLRSEPAPPVARYGLAFPNTQKPLDQTFASFDVAPDGSWIVYVGPGDEGGQLWVKQRGGYEATPLAGTTGARAPSASPDGQWIAFFVGNQLRKIPLQGGAAITLADSASGGFPAPVAWLDDGTVAYHGNAFDLRRVSASGGPSEILWDSAGGILATHPAALPGSPGLLFTVCDAGCANLQDVWVLNLETREARTLIPGAAIARWASDGHLVFLRDDGALFAAPFDLRALEVTGPAIPLLERIKVDAGIFPDFALGRSGTLLMMAGPGTVAGPDQEAVWVTRAGGVQPVDPTWRFYNARNAAFALSPDASRLAIGLYTSEGDDVWIKQLDAGALERLTYDPAEDAVPRWSPDGRSVYFLSRRPQQEGGPPGDNLYMKRADGAGTEELVLAPRRPMWETTATPDGSWIVARVGGTTGQTGGRDIVAFQAGDTTEIPLLSLQYDEVSPSLSPDGRWLAYSSVESGQSEVYVRPFPDVESGRWAVSVGGGHQPRWSRDGRELFYITLDRRMTAVAVSTRDGFGIAERRLLFEIPQGFLVSSVRTTYDVSPDGERFLMVRAIPSTTELEPSPLILVENWFAELREKIRGR